jgi:hypothetical protein
MDAMIEAQRREIDFTKRAQIIKDIQMYASQKFYLNPGRSLYTSFSFRWPWLHNSTYAQNRYASELGAAVPEQGGHLHWLDAAMPNRDKRV